MLADMMFCVILARSPVPTFLLGSLDASFRLLVRSVEDGNVKAFLGNVQGKVLQNQAVHQ